MSSREWDFCDEKTEASFPSGRSSVSLFLPLNDKKKKEQKSCEIPEIQVLKPQNKPSRSLTAGDLTKLTRFGLGYHLTTTKLQKKKLFFFF